MRTTKLLLLFCFISNLVHGQEVISTQNGNNNFSNALVLDGCTNYFEIPDNDLLDYEEALSLECWIQPNCEEGNKIILSKQWCNGQYGYYLSVRNGKLLWTYSSSGNCTPSSVHESINTEIVPNQFTHVAVVHTLSEIKLFVNGIKVVSEQLDGALGEIKNSSEPFRIGAYKNIAGKMTNHFSGLIDEVRLWNIELNETLIQQRKDAPLVGNELGLNLYLNMEQSGQGASLILENQSTYGDILDAYPFDFSSHSPYTIENEEYDENIISLGEDISVCSFPFSISTSIDNYKSILWSTGSTDKEITVLNPGEYSVIVETELCKFYYDTIQVEQELITYEIKTSVCESGAYLFNGKRIDQSGTYRDTLKTIEGCDSIDILNLEVLPVVNTAITESICQGSSYFFASQELTETGIYLETLTATNGCDSILTLTLAVLDSTNPDCNTDPCITKPFSIVNYPNQNICTGESVELSVTGGTTYSWAPALGLSATNIANPSANPITTTTYTVIVTNADGCAATDDITINVSENPIANAGSDVSICSSSSTTLNASGGTTYQWSPTSGLSNPSIANPIATPANTTTYLVTASNSNGCTSIDEVVVDVAAELTVDAGEDIIVCPGEATPLNASGGSSYSWSPVEGLSSTNIANPTVTISEAITYCVTVTDANGCSGSDCIAIQIDTGCELEEGNEEPGNTLNNCTDGPLIFVCHDRTICPNEQTQLIVNGGIRWEWSPATGLDNPFSDLPIASPSVTTTYTVTVWDENDCFATEQVVVTVDPKESCDATPPPCFGDLIPEEKICIDPTDNSIDICLGLSEEDQTKYKISVDGNVAAVLHGCNFEQLIGYQYNLLSNQTDNYKVKSWQINDVYYSGLFNTIQELVTWMQGIDPTGNWKLAPKSFSITGGNTASVYDTLLIQQSPIIEIGLVPNTTHTPRGTLVQVDMTGKDRETLTIVEVATGCREEVLIERCK